MADYLKALGRIAAEKSSAAATGFVRGAKGAFLSEMPGVTSAAGFASSLKRYGNSKEAEVVKEQKVNNVISLEMVRQLRSMNANITNQTRIAAAAERRASAAAAFAEENEREKALRDDKLLKAIEKIGAANDSAFRGGRGGAGKSFLDGLLGEGKDSFLGSLAGGAVGTVLASVAKGAITSLIRGGALAGLAVGVFKLVSDYLNEQAVKNGLPRGSLQTMGPGLGAQGPGAFAPNSVSKNVTGGQGQAAALMALSGGSRAPLSVRQNNPGAMRPAGASKGFQSYKTPQEGISALERQLYLYLTGKSAAAGYKKLDTIAKMISVYAPSNENKTQNYINFVSEKTGIAPDQKLKPGDIPAIAKAITEMEGGKTALQYFYGDNRGSAQRYGGGPPPTGAGVNGPVSRSLSSVLPITDTGDEVSRLRARYPAAANAASGTNLQGYVSFNQREELAKRFYFDTSTIAKNTARTAKGVEAQNRSLGVRGSGSTTLGRQVRPVQDPFTKYYESRTEALSKQFESTTRKLINSTITRAIFPDGIPRGIARETERNPRPGFLGNRISEYFSIQKKLTPTMNRIFGKQFGGQYASIFSQAGSLLLDKGANALGGMLGFDQNSPFSFQQVLGNILTKGKGKQAAAQRKLGREQAIFSLLGIPTGATTGLAFAQRMMPSLFGNLPPGATPQQQIAGLTNSALNMFGINQSTFGGILGGGMGMLPGTSSSLFKSAIYDGVKITQNDANVLKVQEGFTYDSWESATNQQEGFFNTLGAGLSKVFSNVGGGLADVMGGLMGPTGLGGILNWGFNLLAGLFSGSGGGSGGGMFGGGGGGFFSDLGKAWSGEMSWGDAILNTGMKVGGNILTNYAAYKITKNIDNPYARFFAQQVGNYAIKSGLQYAADSFGYGDVASKFLGKDTGLTTALKTGDFSSLNPFSSAGSSSAGYNLAGEAGLKTGVNLTMPGGSGLSTEYNDFGSSSTAVIPPGGFGGMDIGTTSLNSLGSEAGSIASSGADLLTGGVDAITANVLGNTGQIASSVGDAAALGMDSSASSSFLGDLPGVGDVLPYAGAIVKLFQGDIKGAAISAGATYAVNAIAQYLNIGFPGLGLVAGFVVNAIVGKADPRCTWAIYVNGNSDPSAGRIISEGKKTPGSMKDATTKIGIMLFAMLKKAQITVNGPLAYDYFTIGMHGKSKTSTVGVGKGEFKEKGNKEVITVSLDEISTAQGMNKVTQALMDAMLEETSAEKKAAAQSSVSKLTKPELESGVVAGAGEEFKDLGGTTYATKFEKNLNQQFNSGRSTETVSTGEDTYTKEVIGTRQVWNEKLGKVVDEPNPLIMGYNKEGQAVDLKGNVVDFSSFSSAAGFKDDFAVRAATEGGYTGSGEDSIYINPVERQVFNAKTGQYQAESNSNIVGYDRDGKPVLLKSSTENVASPVTSGSTLTYQNLQQQNEELKNSNPSTSDASNGSTAVVNSGNVVNNNQSTIVNNTSSSKEKFFGTVSSEFSPAFAV